MKTKQNVLFGIITLVAIIGLSVVGCSKGGGGSGGGGGKLSGTYVNEDLAEWTMTFSGNKVTTKMMDETVVGTFKIDGDEITMTINGETATSKFKLEGNRFTLIAGGGIAPVFIKK